MTQPIYTGISEETLSIQKAADFVDAAENGALNMFVGKVRNHNMGKAVNAVSYDVFAPLACNVFQEISAEDAAKLMGKAVFIDVREAHELASGRIPKALHIPLGTLLSNEDSVGDIASDTPVIIYCQHGIRSFSAASHLVALGFRNVAHITGGIVRWKDELA